MMTIQLDHFIVPSRDKDASAELIAEIFGAPWAKSGGGLFANVYVNDGLTLNFIEADREIPIHHYCFRVGEQEFDSILKRLGAAGISHRSTAHGPVDMQINTRYGGRNIYWSEPGGHEWEILTVSYARLAGQ